MSNIINGWNHPRFRITDLSEALVQIIDLPLCNFQSGMSETSKKMFKSHELETRQIINFDYKQERMQFSLDYSQLIEKPTALTIQTIENYLDNFDTYRVFLYPRADNLSRFFEVILPPDYGYTLNIHANGINAIGNKGVLPTLISKFGVSKNWMDIDNLSFQNPYQMTT